MATSRRVGHTGAYTSVIESQLLVMPKVLTTTLKPAANPFCCKLLRGSSQLAPAEHLTGQDDVHQQGAGFHEVLQSPWTVRLYHNLLVMVL